MIVRRPIPSPARCPECVRKYYGTSVAVSEWEKILRRCPSCLGLNRAQIPVTEVIGNIRQRTAKVI